VQPGCGGCCGDGAKGRRWVVDDVSALPHGARIGAVCLAADGRELDMHAVRPDVDRGPPENRSRIHAICGCARRTLTGAAPPTPSTHHCPPARPDHAQGRPCDSKRVRRDVWPRLECRSVSIGSHPRHYAFDPAAPGWPRSDRRYEHLNEIRAADREDRHVSSLACASGRAYASLHRFPEHCSHPAGESSPTLSNSPHQSFSCSGTLVPRVPIPVP
jgi:hypothetical protein